MPQKQAPTSKPEGKFPAPLRTASRRQSPPSESTFFQGKNRPKPIVFSKCFAVLFAIFLLAAVLPVFANATWYNGSWGLRRQLSITNNNATSAIPAGASIE